MIKVNAIGRLVNDVTEVMCEEKVFNSFSLACRRDKDNTDFIDCFAFTDAIGKFAKKGDTICITGDLVQDSYENKEGKKVTKYKVNVTGFEFCGGKKSE